MKSKSIDRPRLRRYKMNELGTAERQRHDLINEHRSDDNVPYIFLPTNDLN